MIHLEISTPRRSMWIFWDHEGLKEKDDETGSTGLTRYYLDIGEIECTPDTRHTI